MSLLPLLVLPLVGGYVFSVVWKATHYIVARESGHKLYFRAIYYGVFLFLVSSCLHILLYTAYSWYRDFVHLFTPLFHKQDLGVTGKDSRFAILLMSFFLGPVLGYVLNFPAWTIFQSNIVPDWIYDISYATYNFYLGRAITNNDFELMMFRSCDNEIPVMFTLSTNKVYVGMVNFLPNPAHERKSVRIMPFLSGYRDNETHKFHITENYYHVIEPYMEGRPTHDHLSLDDFDIILPSSQMI